MPELEPTLVEPTDCSISEMALPDPLDLAFEGFQEKAFAVLERLQAHPHIEQYRKEKPDIERYIKAPFKRYRNDLVVNWVLPNRLGFETEKHVFSRLLKNDFGAGGCHHHKWMAFYRPGRRRLTDLQVTHSLFPDSFRVGLFVGARDRTLRDQALGRVMDQSDRFLSLVNQLLQKPAWQLFYSRGSGKSKRRIYHDAPLDTVPDDIGKAKELWIRTRFGREEVSGWEAELVPRALDAVLAVWPIYRFLGRKSSLA